MSSSNGICFNLKVPYDVTKEYGVKIRSSPQDYLPKADDGLCEVGGDSIRCPLCGEDTLVTSSNQIEPLYSRDYIINVHGQYHSFSIYSNS